MKFSSNQLSGVSSDACALFIVFLAVAATTTTTTTTTTTSSPHFALVQSFQPVIISPKTPFRGSSFLRDSSSPQNGDATEPVMVTATATDAVETSSSSFPVAVASPTTNTATTTSSSSATVAVLPANTMDEWIFGFNKKLIDTVYDVICFLYPVKGNERDFARFYVLETVARVPYFAYLSCMHLRETFGERYDSMSDRCVQYDFPLELN